MTLANFTARSVPIAVGGHIYLLSGTSIQLVEAYKKIRRAVQKAFAATVEAAAERCPERTPNGSFGSSIDLIVPSPWAKEGEAQYRVMPRAADVFEQACIVNSGVYPRFFRFGIW